MGLTTASRFRRVMHVSMVTNDDDHEGSLNELERNVQQASSDGEQERKLEIDEQDNEKVTRNNEMIETRMTLDKTVFSQTPLSLSEGQINALYPKLKPFLISSLADLLDIPNEMYKELNVDKVLVSIVKSRLRNAKANCGLKRDSSLSTSSKVLQTNIEHVQEAQDVKEYHWIQSIAEYITTPFAMMYRVCEMFDINLTNPDYDNIVAVLEVVALLQTLILGISIPMASELPATFNEDIFNPNSTVGNHTNSYLLSLQEDHNRNLVISTQQFLAGELVNSVALNNYYLAQENLSLSLCASIIGVSIAALCFISILLIRKEDTNRLRLWYQWFFPAIFLGEVSVVVALFAFGAVIRGTAILNSNVVYFVMLRERLGIVAGFGAFTVLGSIVFTFLINSDWVMHGHIQKNAETSNTATGFGLVQGPQVVPTSVESTDSISVPKPVEGNKRRARVGLLNRRTVPPALMYATLAMLSMKEKYFVAHLWNE